MAGGEFIQPRDEYRGGGGGFGAPERGQRGLLFVGPAALEHLHQQRHRFLSSLSARGKELQGIATERGVGRGHGGFYGLGERRFL